MVSQSARHLILILILVVVKPVFQLQHKTHTQPSQSVLLIRLHPFPLSSSFSVPPAAPLSPVVIHILCDK